MFPGRRGLAAHFVHATSWRRFLTALLCSCSYWRHYRQPRRRRKSAAMPLPRIAIATGDPAGIGPEIALKAALDMRVHSVCRPLLVGDPRAVEMHARAAGLSPNLHVVRNPSEARRSDGTVSLLDARDGGSAPIKIGTIAAA